MMTSYIKETGMLVNSLCMLVNLLTKLAQLVNTMRPRPLLKGHGNQSAK